MGFISKEGLEALKRYKYVSGGYSWLDNRMNPFWTGFVEYLPTWVAPNLMTITGFFIMFFSTLLTLYFNCSLTGHLPSFVFVVMSIALFSYQTLDASDGKQARRIGASSPLGQLIDHGCDSFIMTFLILGISQAVILESLHLRLLFIIFQGVIFVANWAEYHTKTLHTHVGNIGVTEGQFIVIGFYLSTAIFGQDIWGKYFYGFKLYMYFYFLIVGLAIFLLIVFFFKNLAICKDKVEASCQWLPILFCAGLEVFWFSIDDLKECLGITIFCFGILFSTITCKMIVCSLTEMKFPMFHYELAIPTVLLIIINLSDEITSNKSNSLNIKIIILAINNILILFNSFLFFYRSISQITEYLGIYCFSVKKKIN